MDVREIEERQPALQVAAHRLALVGRQVVPFVDADRQGPAPLQHEPDQGDVLLGDTRPRIQQHEHGVCLLEGLQGLHDAEALDHLVHARLAANAGSVHQQVVPAVMAELHLDTVAGGPGLVGREQPVFTEVTVDQGRLANIGPADHGDTGANGPRQLVGAGRCRQSLRQLGEDSGGQQCEAVSLQCRDRDGLAKAEFVEGSSKLQRLAALRFVDGEHGALARLADARHDIVIVRQGAAGGFDHQDHHVGFANRVGHLAIDQRPEAVVAARLDACEATGIDDDGPLPGQRRVSIQAVACKAGKVGDQRIPGTCQRIEERGFADVGAAD